MAETYSKAEERALVATNLDPFAVQLPDVRRTVKHILNLFGRNNFFREYTVHDFSHVESMLADLEWIIPDSAKQKMTPADWLMITLAIYFHDLGLVVTEDEFVNRDVAGFQKFCDEVLFTKDDGKDYKIKVEALGPELAERFFYQEFVRFNHAKRIRAWIEGTPSNELGYAAAQRAEIEKLFTKLDPDFRKDLAMVCESHNLDDLRDSAKYKTFKPYGSTPDETANLLYASAILRTVDLLQITKNRAPSVMFRMINPTDPISQIEWTKQNAVKGVFPKPVMDRNGVVDPNAPPHTVSVFAKFDNENGFFGLTSYLAYANAQIAETFAYVQKANAGITNKLDFPWREIDDSQVEAVGFIPSPFEFQIDQEKILDLLTGHTLYNDSSVAIRELVQNSIDAVRLQYKLNEGNSDTEGNIVVTWSSKDLTLTIQDNGTGMTQEIIERHLLNVGSSRYQDPKFKETFPDFSPISRFGIGVLSTFMVADNVQIVTFHQDEVLGRRISLRSVHGKYLILLLEKETSDEYREIGPHGTKIVLKMRASAKRVDVLETLQRWILFPRCMVTAKIDDSPPQRVGFSSPKEAIEAFISNAEHGLKPELIEVHEKQLPGATLAFATSYNPHFRDRSFVQFTDSMNQRTKLHAPMGICVEGIRVEFGTPGISVRNRSSILSIVNCIGNDAPKTNVARSALESETDRAVLYEKVFDSYLAQVEEEILRLQKNEKFSLSYAVEQFPFIAGPLYANMGQQKEAPDRFKDFPMFLMEDDVGRRSVSISELNSMGGFWTAESSSIHSLIELLTDTPADVTCKNVAKFSKFKGAPLPSGNLVTNVSYSSIVHSLMESRFEISDLHAYVNDRRIDAKWSPTDSVNPGWLNARDIEVNASPEIIQSLRNYRRVREERRLARGQGVGLRIPLRDCKVAGLENYFSVLVRGAPRLLPGTPIASFLAAVDFKTDISRTLEFLIFVDALSICFDHPRSEGTVLKSEIEYSLKELTARFDEATNFDSIGFLNAVSETTKRLAIFNPWSWRRDDTLSNMDF